MLKEMQSVLNELKVRVPRFLQFWNSPETIEILCLDYKKRKKIFANCIPKVLV